jgi:hypothetical protein
MGSQGSWLAFPLDLAPLLCMSLTPYGWKESLGCHWLLYVTLL